MSLKLNSRPPASSSRVLELQVGVATPGLGLGDLSWDEGRVQDPKASSQLETL